MVDTWLLWFPDRGLLGMAYTWRGCFPRRSPNREKTPPPPGLGTRGIIDPPTWGGHRGLVVGVFDCGPIGRLSNLPCAGALCPPPQWFMHGWINKGIGIMSSRFCATGHLKYPVTLIEKQGRIQDCWKGGPILGLYKQKKSYTTVCSHPEDGLRYRQGVTSPLKLKLSRPNFSYGKVDLSIQRKPHTRKFFFSVTFLKSTCCTTHDPDGSGGACLGVLIPQHVPGRLGPCGVGRPQVWILPPTHPPPPLPPPTCSRRLSQYRGQPIIHL